MSPSFIADDRQGGSMRFFLNSSAADGIRLADATAASTLAASSHNWPESIRKLSETHCTNGPVGTVLEINSHGHPGELEFTPAVSFHNVQLFAKSVRSLIQPNSLIEVLACSVASFSPLGLAKHIKTKNRTAATWIERTFSSEVREHNREVKRLTPGIKTKFTQQQIVEMAGAAIAAGCEDFEDEEFKNGPLFCVRLAMASLCKVRAAMIPQLEEGKDSAPIGNWEGHVLDFLPSGSVTYAGFNLVRTSQSRPKLWGKNPVFADGYFD
jgi:hypothetical protein